MQMHYQDYYESVLGGWFGKFIGSTLGAPLEGEKMLHNRTYYDKVPDAAAWNDDNDFQVLWLMLLEKLGPNLNARNMAKYFREQITYPWNEYGYARKNWDQAIWPPVSGWFNNDYFRNSMGCPVRSEIWAFVYPSQPDLAVKYARMDASLDHAEESIEAEAFLAAIESLLFEEKDIETLICKGLEWINPNSHMAEMVRRCMDLHKRGVAWELARHTVLNRYGNPDFTAVLQNHSLIILALLYGEGDFERSILLALNGGYDSDCTCATVGAILGAVIGAGAIPAKWKDPLNNTFKACLRKMHVLKISEFAERTCRMGLQLLKRSGEDVQIVGASEVNMLTAGLDNAPVQVEFEYDDLPALRPGVMRTVTIVLANRTNKDVACELAVASPQPFISVSIKEARLQIAKNSEIRIPVTIDISQPVETLPQTNHFSVTIRQGNTLLCEEIFGLAGEHYWEAFGAFWDVYDRKNIPSWVMNAHKGADLPPWDCMFANEINIDKAYLDESA
ncbi:MAG: ADP-ribosylglycohydrolase family protein, partial [Patescibacteria group bacterium]